MNVEIDIIAIITASLIERACDISDNVVWNIQN